GRLFGGECIDNERGDLLIALIPHIVRTPDYSAENMRAVYAGTDQQVKVQYAPKRDAGAGAQGGAPGAPIVTPPGGAVPPAPAEAPKPDVPAGNPVVQFSPASPQVALSAAV